MSVIQRIRDKYAAAIIALIAISLIAFILMDAKGGLGRAANAGGSTLGKVNGEKIDRADFEKKINMQQAMYGQQAPPREQLMGQVWQQTVEEVSMNQEYEKLGLQYTPKELNDELFGANPPQWLSSQFKDKVTGAFDANAAKQYFAQVKKQKNSENAQMINDAYITPTISQGLKAKYMALVSISSYVPKWMAEKSLAEQSSVAKISYVSVPYASITDTTLKVSDDEVQAYINKHKADFKQEEASRSISYVTFNANPSGQDTLKVLTQLMSMKNDFANAADAEAYIGRISSEIPYFNGFTLGSKMQVPNADSIKNLANGQTFGPYLDGKNFVIAKMIDRRSIPDSAKVRHILVKTGDKGQKTLSDSIGKMRIDSIAAAAQSGADFNTLVQQSSDDEGSKSTKGEYTFASTQFGGLSKEFAEVAFYGKVGDKKVVKVENGSYSGYHYIEVLEQKNPGIGYKVAYLAKPIDASQETINNANGLASQFAAASRNKELFDENAKKQSLATMNIADIKENDYQVPGLGDNRSFVRWVYESKTGDVSEPFEINDKYIVAVTTAIADKGLMSVAKARPTAEPMIMNEKKALQILNTKFKTTVTDLNQAATAAGVMVMTADSVSFSQGFIPNLGNEPKVTGAAFNKALQGKVSEPIAGNAGVYIVKAEGVRAVPNTTMDVEGLRKQMENQQKQMGGYRSMEALKKAADVSDKRFDFY